MCNFLKKLLKKKNKNKKKNNKHGGFNDKNRQQVKKSDVVYEKKKYMTRSESVFYKKLTNIFSDEYLVVAQVPLSSIVRKESDERFQNELYRIIDFALIDRETMSPKILIELNDKSHFEKGRQYRDIRVKEICGEAKIPLLTFWTNYDNEERYIKNRIEKTLSGIDYN